MERTDKEIEAQVLIAHETSADGSAESRWPGMSYEDGVLATLYWIEGDREEPPMDG